RHCPRAPRCGATPTASIWTDGILRRRMAPTAAAIFAMGSSRTTLRRYAWAIARRARCRPFGSRCGPGRTINRRPDAAALRSGRPDRVTILTAYAASVRDKATNRPPGGRARVDGHEETYATIVDCGRRVRGAPGAADDAARGGAARGGCRRSRNVAEPGE